MALKSTSLWHWHCPFPNHWRPHNRISRKRKATICPHFLSTCNCVSSLLHLQVRSLLRKRIFSHRLFQRSSTQLLQESTVPLSYQSLPFPRFQPTVVLFVWHLPFLLLWAAHTRLLLPGLPQQRLRTCSLQS